MARNRVVRRSGGFRSSPGRLTEWFGRPFDTDAVTLPLASFVVDSSLDASGLAKRPFTITRMVGSITIYSDQAGAVEHPFGAVGALVASDKAVTTGATAIPDPVTNVGSDLWFMYMAFAGPQSTAIDGPGPVVFPFDSRAQRKGQEGDDLAVVVANANAVDGLRFTLNYRLLVKLS